jgi:hypothetical protein
MSTWRRRIPVLLAFALGVAAWHLGLWLVEGDLAERQAVGYTGRGQYRFVVLLSLGTAVLAYWSSRRFLFGPRLTLNEGWAVYRPPDADAELPSIDALMQALARHGYKPQLSPLTDAEPGEARWLLRHEGMSHGGVLVDLRRLRTDGVGLVEASDTSRGVYPEMAQYAIYELGRLAPGLRYRGAFSSLSAESTETLEPQLPDRPHYLPRRSA